MPELARRVIGEVLRLDPAEIPDDARSEDLPGWDSLAHLELMLALEAELGIRIPTDTMLELTSVPAIERFVASA